MSFEKLLEELDVMAKAIGADEEKKDDQAIQAAAAEGAEGGEVHPEPDADNAGGQSDDDEDNKDEPMGKSFAFTLDDGSVVEALDGTAMVKALMDRVENTEGVVAKALGQAIDLIGKQGEMIKSMQGDIKKLSGEGRGRKAVLSVAEKSTPGEAMVKSEQPGLSKQEFFAKANAAFDSGRITGKELTVIDVSLRSGSEIDQGLVSKVVG